MPIKLNRKVSSIIVGLFISAAFGHGAVWAQMFPPGFLPSPKLEAYLEKVKKETRRELLIERSDMSLIGETASHWPHPTHVLVIVHPSLNVSDPDFERKIAHEVTHGLLFYARGYSRLEVKPSSSLYGQRVAMVVNGMVDELVVNKLIQAEGYSPFGPNYLTDVKGHISAARSRRNPYPDYGLGAMFRSKYMVLRYILAWGFLQFYAIDPETRSLLILFLNEFEAAYPHEYEMAIEVKKILSQQNIFESGGQTRALEEIVELWNLEEVLQVRDK